MEQFIYYDFDITCIKHAYYSPAKTTLNSFHKNRPFHGLVLFLEGTRYYRFSDGKTILNKASEILYLPKGTTYAVEALAPSGFYVINFDMASDVNFNPFSLSLKNPTAILDLFAKTDREWKKQRPSHKNICMSYLYQIIYLTCLEYQNKYKSSKLTTMLSTAFEYIHSNYTSENISIPHLAKLCGMSESYFRRIFEKTQMTSPIKYINNLRLLRAKKLLALDEHNISTIAGLSGFQSDAYFSREFKKAFGVSPSDFRNKEAL